MKYYVFNGNVITHLRKYSCMKAHIMTKNNNISCRTIIWRCSRNLINSFPLHRNRMKKKIVCRISPNTHRVRLILEKIHDFTQWIPFSCTHIKFQPAIHKSMREFFVVNKKFDPILATIQNHSFGNKRFLPINRKTLHLQLGASVHRNRLHMTCKPQSRTIAI